MNEFVLLYSESVVLYNCSGPAYIFLLLSINFLLLTISSFIDDLNGQIFAFYILVVAAAESAIGLSILVAYYRVKGSISVKFINLLKG